MCKQKKRTRPFRRVLSKIQLLLDVLLAEVALEQAFESLAMARLVAGHLMHGVRRFAPGISYLIYIFEASSVQVLYFSITSF